LGAAILAATGAGLFSDIGKATENVCKVDNKWNPDLNRQEYYQDIYQLSNDLYKILNEKNFYKTYINTLQNKKLV
jgi:ribulose kinase